MIVMTLAAATAVWLAFQAERYLAWMRVQFQRGAYLRGLGHAFAGLIVAGPSSLVQRHTGLVVPAFDARKS